jgi:hypothetical protein
VNGVGLQEHSTGGGVGALRITHWAGCLCGCVRCEPADTLLFQVVQLLARLLNNSGTCNEQARGSAHANHKGFALVPVFNRSYHCCCPAGV